jgi:hypothetical protein
MNHTTKRFSRTLDEAFGLDARSAYPIERHRVSVWERLADVSLAVVIGFSLAIGAVQYFVG